MTRSIAYGGSRQVRQTGCEGVPRDGESRMRTLSQPSRAKCNLTLYTLFLLAAPKSVRWQRLAQILEHLSHDSINRFCVRARYTPRALFEWVRPRIQLHSGTLSGDDTVLDKPYSNPSKTALVAYCWFGKHKKVVKGIHLITLYDTDPTGVSVPVNDRLKDKTAGTTKHEYFRARLTEVMGWGLLPERMTADSWYAGVATLTRLQHQEWGLLFAIERNRRVVLETSA